jgi:benzoyl-CoA reductase/2-hydroxyglutaryl-CoA dehydratase subunit BcrC/BadD/HgdB
MTHKERSGERSTLAAVEKARLINRSFPHIEPIQKWKEIGKKVIGYTCTYVPEEIIHAAGMLPVRVTGGSKQIALADADMQLNPKLCSYSRTCYQVVCQGDYSFLDGLIVGSTCDAMRRLFDAWKYYGTMPFTYIIDVPLILNQ